MIVRRGQATVRLGAGLLLAMACAAAPAVVLAPPAAGDQTTPGVCNNVQPSASATSTELGGTVEVTGDCFPARSEGQVEIFIQGEPGSQQTKQITTEGGQSVHASFEPTEAGEYQAVIEVGGETATATFTVSPSEEPTDPPTEEPTEPPEEEPSPGDSDGNDDAGGDEDTGGNDGTGGDDGTGGNGTGGDDTGGNDDTGSDDGTGGNDGSDGGTGGDDGSDNGNTGDGGAGDDNTGNGSADGDGGADEGNGAGSEGDTDGNGSGEDAGPDGSSDAGDSNGDGSDQGDGSAPDENEDSPPPSAGEKPNPPSHKPDSSAPEDPDSTTDDDAATTPEHTQEQEEAAELAVLMTSLFAHGVSDGEAGLSPAEVEAELSDNGSGASDGEGVSDDSGEELAETGADVTVLAALAGLTLIGGAGLVWHQRRRRDWPPAGLTAVGTDRRQD